MITESNADLLKAVLRLNREATCRTCISNAWSNASNKENKREREEEELAEKENED
jgi:hypothetical protein